MIPGMFFANPWGLLALAALPVIVGIHCLQEKSRRVRASTLFLLERAAPLPSGGIRLEKFRNSLPFWMQLLAAAALAWLLADPRWIRSDSRQTVAVVLDSSASMQAGRAATLDLLARRLAAWDAVAARTDWHLLETGPGRPPLYAGRNLGELLAAAKDWRPTLGTHDFSAALGIATNLVPPAAGVVILVTDRPVDVPGGVAVLAAGTSFDNVGFSGGDVGRRGAETGWRVLVTNHGTAPQRRDVSVRTLGTGTGTAAGPAQSIRLEPGQSRTLEGRWPDGAERIVIGLSGDRFAWDDALPLVRPVDRTVKVAIGIGGPVGELLAKMIRAADGVEIVTDPATADLVVGPFTADATTDSIQIAVGDLPAADAKPPADGAKSAGQEKPPAAAAAPVAFDPAWVAAEDHPLTRDLGWGGLLSGPAGNLGLTATDEPLLWKGGRPLAFVRSTRLSGGRIVRSLVLNFDLAGSTAARTPALVVLVQRFIDRIRSRIPRPWADNFETGQAIDLPEVVRDGAVDRITIESVGHDGGPAVTAPFRGRAPEEPGFFTVTAVRGTPPATVGIVAGAAQFADSRECDFRAAAAIDTLEAVRMERALKQSIEDPWAPLWLGLTIAALLVAWGWRSAGERPAPVLAYTRSAP